MKFVSATTIAFTTILVTACGSQSFRYTAAEPVRYEPLKQAKQGPAFYGDGTGPMWSKCSTVNAEAVEEMMSHAQSGGYDAVADIKWYDYASGKWVKEPTCRTEYGWLAGTLYTFWWPNATKVRVQARGIKPDPAADTASIFRAKTVGEKELNSQGIRKAHPHDTSIAVELESGFVNGAGVEVGHFVAPDTRWAANLELAVPFGETFGCGPYVSGWGTLALRREQFVGNSFYYAIGPAIQDQPWFANCDPASSGLVSPSSTTTASKSGRWQYGLVGVDAGIGNEWRGASGLFGGCEWAGGFFGVKVWHRGDEIKGGEKMPLPFTPRLLACHLGVSL